MNAVTPFPDPAISEAERERRIKEVAFARGSVRLEGFTLSPEVEEINRKYIAGELTSAEHVNAIVALHS